MKVSSEKIIYPVQSSFKVLKYAVPQFDMPFHYHSEYELVYITQGSGQRYIGKSIHNFRPGDMVFMGPELAHIWVNEKQKQESGVETEAIVLQFSDNLFQSFMDTPEFSQIKQLLNRSQAGLKIGGKTREAVANALDTLLECQGTEKLVCLIRLLDILARADNLVLLNPLDYQERGYHKDHRINVVYHYVISKYQQRISVDEVARLAHMEKSAFCRFFKTKTQKTFTRFVNETRVNHACGLLLENKLSVSQIAYEVGFNNLANFYRQFQKITGKTPGEFKNDSN
ncbi:MAG: AraC family transcriptional regulator [Candidatus Marinimicrobia bacterium]|nr:AraC family transcriptional regulator [Candidatus Neomarinimicrobiota bacterium]